MPERIPAAATMDGVLRAKKRDIEAGRAVPTHLLIIGNEQPVTVPLPRLTDAKAREAFLAEQGRLYAGVRPQAVLLVGVEANSNLTLFEGHHSLVVAFLDYGGYSRGVVQPYVVADGKVCWLQEDVTTNAQLATERNELAAFFRGVKEAQSSARAAPRRTPAWRFRR